MQFILPSSFVGTGYYRTLCLLCRNLSPKTMSKVDSYGTEKNTVQNRFLLILKFILPESTMTPFFVLGAFIGCMFAWYGAADQLHSYGCANPIRSKVTSCTMPRLLSSSDLLKRSRGISASMYVLQLCSTGEVQCIAATLSTCHREGLLQIGSLPGGPTCNKSCHGTARGLRPFWACTATRIQLAGRNLPCKHTNDLQQHVI